MNLIQVAVTTTILLDQKNWSKRLSFEPVLYVYD